MRYDDVPTLLNWKADAFDLHLPPVHPRAAEIDDLIAKYHQTFTPMAKRNVLTALQVASEKWRKEHLGSTPPVALAALDDVVKRRLAYSGSVAHTYERVLCIGYEVETGSLDVAGKAVYKGQLDDRQDMLARAADLNKAIRAAAGLVSGKDELDAKTLKVFMAPEFYFRGRYGAYSHDVVAEIMQVLRKGGAEDAAFKDWLFVFGTAIAASIDARQYCWTCKSAANIVFERNPSDRNKTITHCKLGAGHHVDEAIFGAIIDNVALIQKGSEAHEVRKEFISGIDFRDLQVAIPDSGKRIDLPVMATEGSRGSHITSLHSDERMGGCVFTMDGVTFGLEICLDHKEKRLENAGNLQVLLIPSAGMDIKTARTIPNGVHFNVDGLYGGRSEVKVYSGGALVTQAARASMAVPGAAGKVTKYGPFDLPWP